MKGERGCHGHTIKPIAEAGEIFGRMAKLGCTRADNCPEKRERTGLTEGRTFVGGGDVAYFAEHFRTALKSKRTSGRTALFCQTCGEEYAKQHGLGLPVEAVV